MTEAIITDLLSRLAPAHSAGHSGQRKTGRFLEDPRTTQFMKQRLRNNLEEWRRLVQVSVHWFLPCVEGCGGQRTSSRVVPQVPSSSFISFF